MSRGERREVIVCRWDDVGFCWIFDETKCGDKKSYFIIDLFLIDQDHLVITIKIMD